MLAKSQIMPESQLWRAVDAVLGLLPTSVPGSDLLWAISDESWQEQCEGCDRVCEILRWGEVHRRRDHAFQGCSPSSIVHESYLELDRCAANSGCDTCRTLRQAFLLNQITKQDAERLQHPENQWPIHASLHLISNGDAMLELAIKSPKSTLFSATVHLSNQPCDRAGNLTQHTPGLRPDLSSLRQAINDCHHRHECSSRYRWSRRNPSWLLKILSDGAVQLVEGPPEPVDYAVLSYSWGDPASMPAEEWARIKGAGTKTTNGRPVSERLNPFSIQELPETMQDAITISSSLGVSYIWIDNVCIPKGTNWDTEASLMHEVYGNSVFTLVASSSTKATDRLLYDRQAWAHPIKPSQLRESWWLHNTQLPLDRVRLESPVSLRAWTLQEERLSPRIVYWAGQQWYWSCLECQVSETEALEQFPRADIDSLDTKTISSIPVLPCPSSSPSSSSSPPNCTQRFLEFCRTGDERLLHEEWLDIVDAYTRRDLVAPRDRFLAIAGLAVRFYNAKAGNGGAVITEAYLAGLWRDDFAHHLAWSVINAADSRQNLQHIAPSWSWASLPLRVTTRTKTTSPFRQAQQFQFLSVEHIDAASSPLPRPVNTGDPSTDYINRGRAVEERGRGVKVVQVQGRVRRFISSDASCVPWGTIERERGGRPGFDFGAFPGQSLYARHGGNGRILSKDAHSGEVVGQLDYLAVKNPPEGNALIEVESVEALPYVGSGCEKEIVCLELGELAMLLLIPMSGSSSRQGQAGESFRRVGVAVGYESRKGFFYGCETKKVLLV
ncbi:heterokaryon incompatibility protein-domain-containing protein [Dichotomopilus funicola]|uniref:Heterokaryon incompatibility protein-domain-containing protein n=1 Tax=Dichotomopilus funicola TaxID=1934379 RepID=A0AAN6V1P2_9PEZI|nr:heterokaryon incompatibility protein-domain-containing protein [Dichotomopilus funicola]